MNKKLLIAFLLLSATVFEAQAQSAPGAVMPEPNAQISSARTKAALIHQRLTGVRIPIDAPILKSMEARVAAGDLFGAATIATSDPEFYNNTVKQFASRMSTRDESVSAGLNDFVATVIGMVRDDRPAREMLTGNYIYVPTPAAQTLPDFRRAAKSQDDYSIETPGQFDFNLLRSNRVYEELDRIRADLSTGLIYRRGQPLLITRAERNDAGNITKDPTIRDNPDPAGLLTTRSFLNSHAIAGTNRRMVQFAFRQFLCIDIAQWADSSAPDSRVGRDVARDPGGDPNFFLRTCKACHSVMDGFRGAFASLDVDNNEFFAKQYQVAGYSTERPNDRDVVNAQAAVASKYARGSGAFPAGYATTDSSWVNFANTGTNAAYFGWRGTNVNSGAGAQSLGVLLSNSQAFSRCMVQRVYRSVCRRDLAAAETEFLGIMTTSFERDYNLKNLFKRVTISPACIGQ